MKFMVSVLFYTDTIVFKHTRPDSFLKNIIPDCYIKYQSRNTEFGVFYAFYFSIESLEVLGVQGLPFS